jgi:hypothetical protein
LSEPAEVRGMARLLRDAAARLRPGTSLAEVVAETEGVALDGTEEDLARPRTVDLYAALVRWRALRVLRPDRDRRR